MVLIHDETSSNTYRFAMNVPPGGRTEVNPDGSATVYDKDGNAVRQIARPWAFDAAGRPQKTWYTVDENGDLIQHVEPADNALYPILADPTSVGLVDTTGRADGESWTQDLGDGQLAVHHVVEGTGGQTVDTRVVRPDATYTDVRSVNDGQGGYQTWSNDSAGSASYSNFPSEGGQYNEQYHGGDVYGDPTVAVDENPQGSGTIVANNPDGTQSTGTYVPVGEDGTDLTVDNPDGSTSDVQFRENSDGERSTVVNDDLGRRVGNLDGSISEIDGAGNEVRADGGPPDASTGRFYDPDTGRWIQGAVDPATGARTIRLDDGGVLAEQIGKDGKPSTWEVRDADGTPQGVVPDGLVETMTQAGTLAGSTALGLEQAITRQGDAIANTRWAYTPDQDFTNDQLKKMGKYGKALGPAGTILTVGSTVGDIANGAGIYESVGELGGTTVGGWGGAAAGATAGAMVGGPVGALVGGAIGGIVGSGVGTKVGGAIGSGFRSLLGG
ncbi:hypothetical protein L5G28_07900 [Gordonia sp. HY285]|uniref:hypothetical protein n=1 Tax=Gordonia liuliyuniae TaxID=2911517 RepID=UPI001F3F54CE|nr:hypothetical protein [Gordonia liuliyuniae]MCF8610085.1 hypothetical protein [Gordonia liuliyuniae]